MSESRRSWLTAKVGEPAHVMSPVGGLAAACLMYAEINGKECISVKAVTNEHSISSESLRAYEQVLEQDLSQIAKMPKFKEELKDANR